MGLQEFFAENTKVAVACSGGVDSTFLLYQAKRWAEDVTAFFVKSAFQPDFELEDATAFCAGIGVGLRVIEAAVLDKEEIVSNPPDRCYYCKREIFRAIKQAASDAGYPLVLEGTNASDDISDRPGVRALMEYGIVSPLRECGYTKEMIRRLSKEAGLPLHDKPAYACLATRIPAKTRITKELLDRIEEGEKILFSHGFTDFRIRIYHNAARIQLKKEEMELFVAKREELAAALAEYFEEILLDAGVCR